MRAAVRIAPPYAFPLIASPVRTVEATEVFGSPQLRRRLAIPAQGHFSRVRVFADKKKLDRKEVVAIMPTELLEIVRPFARGRHEVYWMLDPVLNQSGGLVLRKDIASMAGRLNANMMCCCMCMRCLRQTEGVSM